MDNDKFDELMRSMEIYHKISVPEDNYIILRIDGRGFSKLTEKYFIKPIDSRFQSMMTETTKILVDKLQAIYGYVESDEISILLPKTANWFDREVEKLVSVSAGLATSIFTKQFLRLFDEAEDFPHFDSRIVVLDTQDKVIDYFRWRQTDANRCALNGFTYWGLRDVGYSKTKATKSMDGISKKEKLDLLYSVGTDYESLPPHYKNGVAFYWKPYRKESYNPMTGESVEVWRNKIVADYNLPLKDDYSKFIKGILNR